MGWRHSTTDVVHYAVVYTAYLALGCGTLSKRLIPLIGYTRTTNLLKMWYEQQYYKPMGDNCINIITHLEKNQWNSKNVPGFFCSRDCSLLHSLLGILNLEVHTAGNILCSHLALWSPHRGGERGYKIQQPAAEALQGRRIWVSKQMASPLTQWTKQKLKLIIILMNDVRWRRYTLMFLGYKIKQYLKLDLCIYTRWSHIQCAWLISLECLLLIYSSFNHSEWGWPWRWTAQGR